ncbi:MAG: hypothetical protein ACRDN0_10820 [Trebonia sp.]
MSEPSNMSELTSKKGWASIDYDDRIWIPCPAVFRPGVDREAYAAGVARIWWEQSGIRHTPADVGRLAEMLSGIHLGIYGKIPCHYALIHLPDPRQMPLMLYVGIWESLGDKDEHLRMLCHADDSGAVERPVAEEFATQRLGTGLRVIRYRHLPDGALFAGLAYAWRSEAYETDLLLNTSSEDLGRLQGAIPDIENLARAASIVSQADVDN